MTLKISEINIENILFLDIETVPQFKNYSSVPDNLKIHWKKKSEKFKTDTKQSDDELYNKAGILSEFGKIICISAAYIKKIRGKSQLRVRSFAGDDEKIILNEFLNLFTKHFNTDNHFLCAHNGKEFDFPYIARRALINGIKLPPKFDTRGLKPWEIRHLDTLDLWRFGDYKNYTSLDLLATIFDIPSPKTEMDGSMVYKAYWEDNKLNSIIEYCQEDVIAIVQLFFKYRCEKLFPREDIKFVE